MSKYQAEIINEMRRNALYKKISKLKLKEKKEQNSNWKVENEKKTEYKEHYCR